MNPNQTRRVGPRWWPVPPSCLLAAVVLCGCQQGPDPAGSVVAGRQALGAENFDLAVADADDYLRGQPHGPDAAEAYYIKGSAFQNKSFLPPPEGRRHNLVQAREAYTAGLAERSATGELAGYLHAGLSVVALYQDDFPTVIEQGQKAIPLVARPEVKAGLLYNTGVAQQRLERFGDADQTYAAVQQQYPGSPAAAESRRKQGRRLFYVQLALYASAADADRAERTLRAGGAVVSRGTDAAGATQLTVGPFSSYAAAKQQQESLSGTFPAAVVVP